jgi:hypothetical protein
MDGKFFLLGDGRWARLMNHDLHEGDLFQVYLAAVAAQVREQVIKGLDPWREILLTDSVHFPHKWTSPLTYPRRTSDERIDGHQRHSSMYVQVRDAAVPL